MQKKISDILNILGQTYPDVTIALEFKNPFHLLVATILSAQCTDKRVNIVTKGLFKKYPTIQSVAEAVPSEFENDIRSTGFFRNKAKNIIATSNILVEQYGGKIPKTMEELTALPGIARKTANIILTFGFGIIDGIAVDTHVSRISKRLGLTDSDNPEKIEKQLMAIIPKSEWGNFNSRLVQHGREVCFARKPACSICPLNKVCPSAGKIK